MKIETKTQIMAPPRAGLDPAGIAVKRTIMSNKFLPTLPILKLLARPLIVCLVLAGSHLLISRQAFAGTRFDGTWNLVFVTQRGDCDPTYNFMVDVVNGNITHPNILTFRGRVAPSGAVVASVRVGQRYASGSGRLSGVSGRGVWSGRSGDARCAGTWAAQRN
jgi:hypothetical protein